MVELSRVAYRNSVEFDSNVLCTFPSRAVRVWGAGLLLRTGAWELRAIWAACEHGARAGQGVPV